MNKIINNEITAKRVILIGTSGEQLGEMSFSEAYKIADEYSLDLVQMNDTDIPVCKIMNYSKLVYESKKKNKIKNKKPEMKELKLRPTTDKNDLKRLINQANGFIEKSNNVKFTVQFRGREIYNIDNALLNFDFIQENVKILKGYSIKRDEIVNNKKMVLIISK